MHRAELLSPLLSGLRPDETLSLTIGYDAAKARLDICLDGSAQGASEAEVEDRRKSQSTLLSALVRAQFPGFVFQTQALHSNPGAATAITTFLRPLGRRTAPYRLQKRELGPQLVEAATAHSVLLPAMGLSSERLATAVELLKSR